MVQCREKRNSVRTEASEANGRDHRDLGSYFIIIINTILLLCLWLLLAGKILKRWIPSIIYTKMSFLFLTEDRGLRLSKRSPYSFQLRDAGSLEDGHQWLSEEIRFWIFCLFF